MENETKRKFYEQLDINIQNKRSSNSFLKRGDRKKEPKDYQLLKRYDVVQIGKTGKLIYPVAEGSSSLKYYVQKVDIFDVIHDAHLAIGHGRQNRMIKETHVNDKLA